MKDKNIENKTSASSENLRGTPQSAVRTEKPLTVRKNWLRTLGIILCAAALTLGIVFGVGNFFKTEDNFKIYAANAQAAADWQKAIADSLADSTGATYTVRLEADWGAEGGNFGSGTGYTYGALNVPKDAKIELDLNGHTLSRNLSAARSNGYVINVAGEFTLKDTSGTQLGMVTGGNNNTSNGAGGIYVNNSGTFNFEGGNVANNSYSGGSQNGSGGVYIFTNSNLNMSEGAKISGNNRKGLSCHNYGQINITGGTVSGNSSKDFTAGINLGSTYSSKSSFNASNLTISNNVLLSSSVETYHGAGVYMNNSGTVNLTNCTITGNISQATNHELYDAGAIYNRNTVLVLDNCYISENTSVQGVGGINVYGAAASLNLKNCTISDNEGVYGAMYFFRTDDITSTTIQGCTIQGNTGTYASAINTNNINFKIIIKDSIISDNIGPYAILNNEMSSSEPKTKVQVGGATVISGNKTSNNVSANVFLPSSETIEIISPLTTDASIGVTRSLSGRLTVG